MEKRVFIIVCTGTAGHINPGLSVAAEIQSRLPESEILFIGSDREMEKRLVPKAGYELENIKMSGIRRGIGPKAAMHNIKTVVKILCAGKKVKKILKAKRPCAVIGTGGYICYPVLKTAAGQGIATYVLESNAYPGMTVRMLSGIVKRVMVTYRGYEKYYKKPGRVSHTGTPLRGEFYQSKGEDSSREQKEKPLVVSFWGSLGAEKMNEIMAEFINENMKAKSFRHIHGAGNSKGALMDKLSEIGAEFPDASCADIRDYIEDMPDVMKAADLVLCRAGGITLAELTALGKPSVLVPSAYVPDNVQAQNAAQLHSAGAAILQNESDCTGKSLFDAVSALLSNQKKLGEMSKAAKSLSAPKAVSDIADIIFADIGITNTPVKKKAKVV
ncbi:MAG: UDP-N-acetylglucosamine--N-acetylmuramyl-(pentapeptide) pyrophosphoryl-undecaprenol N-acetylglucosamine transferase [Oscillospiraceae bacterium]|nr:UDP-N-acetylglucosamine--N-acetylmuramyl-(pentapeptide) pyrophosphoryl-undecaprenol N-acetylglucosamine transferase [Oscillospiraceae bacterium]